MLLSREGYGCVVLDLRELGGIGPDGVELLHELRTRAGAGEHDLALVVGPRSRAWLEEIGIGDLELDDDLDAVLARRAPQP